MTASILTSSPRGNAASAEQCSDGGHPRSENISICTSVFALDAVLPVFSAFSAPRLHRELPQCPVESRFPGLVKWTSSPIEDHFPKTGRDSKSLHQPPISPTSSTETPFGRASHHYAQKRASSPARASAFAGSRTVTHPHEFHVGKPLSGHSHKHPHHSPEARVEDDGDVPVSVTSPNPCTTTAFGIAHAYPSFHNSSRVSTTVDPHLAGTTSPAGTREHVGASISNNPSPAVPSPSFQARQVSDLHISSGPRSALRRDPISPSRHCTNLTPRSSIELPPSSTSSDPVYGPGIPIPPPPYQILPAPKALATETDGYIIIRNAIPAALIRELVTVINNGVPVMGKYDKEQTYATLIQADNVRDHFVLNWRSALRPFYEPTGKPIPQMPSKVFVGSFLKTDPKALRQSLVHVGNRDEIYVHIALSQLSPETGFYNILRGSHHTTYPARNPRKDWGRTPTVPIVLNEGDAIIWRGDLLYLLSPKGGGHWQSLTFDWDQDQEPSIDLTE